MSLPIKFTTDNNRQNAKQGGRGGVAIPLWNGDMITLAKFDLPDWVSELKISNVAPDMSKSSRKINWGIS